MSRGVKAIFRESTRIAVRSPILPLTLLGSWLVSGLALSCPIPFAGTESRAQMLGAVHQFAALVLSAALCLRSTALPSSTTWPMGKGLVDAVQSIANTLVMAIAAGLGAGVTAGVLSFIERQYIESFGLPAWRFGIEFGLRSGLLVGLLAPWASLLAALLRPTAALAVLLLLVLGSASWTTLSRSHALAPGLLAWVPVVAEVSPLATRADAQPPMLPIMGYVLAHATMLWAALALHSGGREAVGAAPRDPDAVA